MGSNSQLHAQRSGVGDGQIRPENAEAVPEGEVNRVQEEGERVLGHSVGCMEYAMG